MNCNTNWLCLPVTPCPPPPQTSRYVLQGPIGGVINGMPANAGEVGEFIQRSLSSTVTVAANSNLKQSLAPLILPAGDWNVQAKLTMSPLFSVCGFVLNPTIQGASDNMFAAMMLPGVALPNLVNLTLNSQIIQFLTASMSTSFLFDFTVVNNTASSQTGPYTFTVVARRAR